MNKFDAFGEDRELCGRDDAPADKVREEFEKWASPRSFLLHRDVRGEYSFVATVVAWNTWNDSWLASRNETIKRVREKVETKRKEWENSALPKKRYEALANALANEKRETVMNCLNWVLAELDRELGEGR